MRSSLNPLIDDEGAKLKVRCLIANIGNYAILARMGVMEHLSSPPFPPTAFILSGIREVAGTDDSAATVVRNDCTTRPTVELVEC